MKRFISLVCVLSLCGGCFSGRNAKKSVEEKQLPRPVVQAEMTAEVSPEVAVPVVVTPAAPVKKEVVPTPEIKQTPVQPTSVTPVPDVCVFTDEQRMSLQGRRLSPLAGLAPVSDRQKSSPWQAEQLKYGLYYSFVKVGTAYIKNRGLVDIDGRKAYLLQTTAFSASVIDKVFKVRDINLSWMDAENLYSLGYSQSLREGKYVRDEWVNFDYRTNTYQGELEKKSGLRSISGVLAGPVSDILTSLYWVRGKDLKTVKEVILDVMNREEQYPLVVKVIKRETVKTPAGKFKCIVVEPQFRGEGIFVSKGKSLQVWLTDDERKMPIKMKAEVFIGSVYAELLEYTRN